MLRVASNDAKQRYHWLLKEIKSVTANLKDILDDDHFSTVVRSTDLSREKVHLSISTRLRKKFDVLRGINPIAISQVQRSDETTTTKIVKDAVLNLTGNDLPVNHQNLLNLGPKFVPALKYVPVLDIVTTTEKAALQIERNESDNGSCVKAESLRHNVSNILMKYAKKKLPTNLSKDQENALREMKKDESVKVVPFDKGVGFAVLQKESMLEKISEHVKNARIVSKDPTKPLLSKFQREISRLKKEGKIEKKQFHSMYPSDATPPRLYGFVKAHKPSKDYPMRPVVSTVGSAFYGSSKYLVDLLQPTLNKNLTRVKNSSTFAKEAKDWEIAKDEIQVSYDVVNLYPSIPISKATEVIMQFTKDDWDEIKQRTKLDVKDIESLLRLCLSQCYFLWDDKIFVIDDAGPIGLSLMVTMAEGYLQFLEEKTLTCALSCQPKTFRRYVDDSHVRFDNHNQADEFLTILNSQDSKIQYTIERENSDGVLAFLDISIHNNQSGRYELGIHRKEAITNLQIRPESSVNPSIVYGVLKGFLTRAFRICSASTIQDEIEFLVNMFCENGYSRFTLEKIVEDFKTAIATESDEGADDGADRQDEEKIPIVKIPWIPRIGPKLRASFRKHNVKVVFTAGPSLKDMLCQHKCSLPRNSQPGIYRLDCNCGCAYIGETKKKVSTRIGQHEKDIFKGRWKMSGATEHAETCAQGFKFEEATTVKVEPFYFDRKIREAVEIRAGRRSNVKMLNRDSGSYMKTNQWDVLLARCDVNRTSSEANDALVSNVNSN